MSSTRYQYQLVNVKYVKENPEEYIIPDCLDACKILWDKGISTTQCSNYEDINCRWIEIDSMSLSDENKKIVYDFINIGSSSGFVIGGLTHEPRIYIDKIGIEASNELCRLAQLLVLQDTKRFCTAEVYLDNYKRKDGEYIVLENGEVIRDYNLKYINAILEEALTANNDWNLYIGDEGRIYDDEDALNHHLDYLSKSKKL